MKFYKYHALGNDYIVMPPGPESVEPSPWQIERICHRNFGAGSDGILYGPLDSNQADFGLKIFNPDGSEAEKSGNGLRIFARYLWDTGQVGEEKFSVETKGGLVSAEVQDKGRFVSVAMGQLQFNSKDIPVAGKPREVLQESMEIDGENLTFSAVSIGNPHCVLLVDQPTPEMARTLGPKIENHPQFPNRINVQFVTVLDRENIKIEIWGRGAGYTLASGSSSCAAAGVAFKLGHCDKDLTVHMPGGTLSIQIETDHSVIMQGGVTKVYAAELDSEIF